MIGDMDGFIGLVEAQMRRAIAVMLALGLAAAAPARVHAQTVEQTLTRVELETEDAIAKKDRKRLEAVFADDFVGYGCSGDRKLTKAQIIDGVMSADYALTGYKYAPFTIRVFGRAAVVQGAVVETASLGGRDISADESWLDVFDYRGGAWRLVANECAIVKTLGAAADGSKALLAADRALAAESHAKGFVPAYASAMAPDARKFDGGSPAAIGREAILAIMAGYPADLKLDWTPQEAVVAESGELGFTWGHFIATSHDAKGQPVTEYGKYLDVWRRGPDGVWRWIADMGASDPPPETAATKTDSASSGWIPFTTYTNLGIDLPVRVNGHEAMAWLWGGPTSIDKGFAQSIGLAAPAGPDGAVAGLEIQLGGLTLHDASAKPDDLQAQAYAPIIGGPLVFRLGEEVFNRLAVDIDFAGHRVAFRDPQTLSKPSGAVEVPLVERDGERVVPLSVDGAPAAPFELELGNMNGPLLVTPAFADAHRLLQGRSTSKRLSGPFSETVVSVDHLSFAGVDFPHAPIALIPDTQLPPASIAGGVGLPLLSKFRLVIDYSRNRLYAAPDPASVRTPIAKDRIGLALGRKDADFAVAFVAPHSPAEAAGFKAGERIRLIDGKPLDAWPRSAIVGFPMTEAGTVHTFTMADASIRRVKAVDFF